MSPLERATEDAAALALLDEFLRADIRRSLNRLRIVNEKVHIVLRFYDGTRVRYARSFTQTTLSEAIRTAIGIAKWGRP